MKLVLTKQEVMFIHKLLYSYKGSITDESTDRHIRFVGKLNKKIKRQFLNQTK